MIIYILFSKVNSLCVSVAINFFLSHSNSIEWIIRCFFRLSGWIFFFFTLLAGLKFIHCVVLSDIRSAHSLTTYFLIWIYFIGCLTYATKKLVHAPLNYRKLSNFTISANGVWKTFAVKIPRENNPHAVLTNWKLAQTVQRCKILTVLYCILYCTALYCNVLYCTVLYCTVLYCTVLYCTVMYCTILYCTVLYWTLLYCILLYCIVLCCIVLYCIALYCIVLYCTVLYCIVLYCTVLHMLLLPNSTLHLVLYTKYKYNIVQ